MSIFSNTDVVSSVLYISLSKVELKDLEIIKFIKGKLLK